MALQKAAKPSTMAEEVPDEIPRGPGGRPKIRELIEGRESRTRYVTYTRASTLGKALESDYGIQVWKQRMIVHGLSRRHDLVMKAATIRGVIEEADKKALSAVAEEALEAAKATAGATKGTALHVLSERVDAGEDLAYLPHDVRDALSAYRALMARVRVVASETFVVCDPLDAAGTFDRLVELPRDTIVRYTDLQGVEQVKTLPAGTRLILDLKTNKDSRYFGPTYACQQAVYGFGVPYTHAGGRGTWPDGIAPSQEWALILHVPLESPADSGFHWVDLYNGFELAKFANLVRGQAARQDLFWPTDLASSPAPVSSLNLMAALRNAPDEAALDALWRTNQDNWTDDATRMVRARLAELAAVAG